MGQPAGETSTGLEPAVSKERLLNGPDLDYLLPGCRNVSASREFLCFEMFGESGGLNMLAPQGMALLGGVAFVEEKRAIEKLGFESPLWSACT